MCIAGQILFHSLKVLFLLGEIILLLNIRVVIVIIILINLLTWLSKLLMFRIRYLLLLNILLVLLPAQVASTWSYFGLLVSVV